ncbi:MAG: hypothetical protein U0744_13105 [Gemmataceae bacterium]
MMGIAVGFAIVTWITASHTHTHGQPGAVKTAATPTPKFTPQANDSPAKVAADDGKRFPANTVATYKNAAGDIHFALQVQPKLPAASTKGRDIAVVVSVAANLAGESWTGANQIAEAIVEVAKDRPNDRVSLWTIGTPAQTKNHTEGFLSPKDEAELKKLRRILRNIHKKEYPLGDTDLKDGLAKIVSTFDDAAGRQRIVLFLGDGNSTHNPVTSEDRYRLSRSMVEKHVGFFTVPLGGPLHAENLHGLANATGGVVLRTRVSEEKLVDAMKRYEDAFAGNVMYDAKLGLPSEVTEAYPSVLPPLRGDQPTLVVGRMKEGVKQFPATVTGTLATDKSETTIGLAPELQSPKSDNFFLVSLVDQWKGAKEHPAILRADRALSFAFEQTRLLKDELLVGAHLAMDNDRFPEAARLFQQAKMLAPHDPEAKAGAVLAEKFQSGKVTRDSLRKELAKGKSMVKVEAGSKLVWKDVVVAMAQIDEPAAGEPKKGPAAIDDANFLKQRRDQVIIEEQKITQAVDNVLSQARRELSLDPDGVLDILRNTLGRVNDHPDISDQVRRGLSARLEASLRDAAVQGRRYKLQREEQNSLVAQVQRELERDQNRQTYEERVESLFRTYKNLMFQARFEEKTKQDLLNAFTEMVYDARLKGQREPLSAQAAYPMVEASYQIQRMTEIRRRRQEGFLSTLLEVEKSAIPFPDEPGIFFPPLAQWKALTRIRKEKYEVSSLPDDDKGRAEANAIYKMLQEPLEMKDFNKAPLSVKDFFGLLYEKFAAKGKTLPILVDFAAFKGENPEAFPDDKTFFDKMITFPEYPPVLVTATALRLALSKIDGADAEYVIRRNFIEITTRTRQESEKVLRVYPVGDLAIPISQTGGQQTFGGQFGGQIGGQIGQFGGQIGQFGQIGGQIGQFGQIGGQIGQFGQIGGQIGQFGQIGGQFGQFGQIGGQFGQLGQFGQGGFTSGVPGSFTGGSFQGGFNGSLGAMGASQAVGLISTITKVVAPGTWYYTQQQQPFNPANNFGIGANPFMNNPFGGFQFGGVGGIQFGNFGMFGMGGGFPQAGMFGMVGNAGQFGMVGAGAPPPPPSQGGPADLLTANTIEFFPPALALIIRAPSRVHTSITGGIIGGKHKVKEEGAGVWIGPRDKGEIGIAGAGGNKKVDVAKKDGEKKNDPIVAKSTPIKANLDLDPTVIWDEAIGKGGITPGIVIATADFLFEANQPVHAAEFLKANLRYGVVVRPWVYEALAVALEASKGDPEEIRRARLSAAALDPTDAQGFLKAARAMADNKQFDRALAFCRQASLLEPNLAAPYSEALVYAEHSKDPKGMEWAVGKLLAQDWANENDLLHLKATTGMTRLTQTLKKENRDGDANKLKLAIETVRQRDLVIQLTWEAGSDPGELELLVKEPTGSVCSAKQKQTTGGGIFLPADLKVPNRVSYMAAEGFSGDYEITVSRLWGKTLGNRAKLEVIQNFGTSKERRQLFPVTLDQKKVVVVKLAEGRRNELAVLSPANLQRRAKDEDTKTSSIWSKLRDVSFGDFSNATVRGGAGTTGIHAQGGAATEKIDPAPSVQSALNARNTLGVPLTGSLRMSSTGRDLELLMQPVFQNVREGRPAVNLSVIPGAKDRP